MLALLSGFGLSLSLIVAIGAQNAFVLRQGLKREHVLTVVLVCTICDFGLIVLGVLGFGGLVARFPPLTSIAAWGGALFLIVYGIVALRNALQVSEGLKSEQSGSLSYRVALLTALALSLLNPHVYLDTVVLIGSLAAQYQNETRLLFGVGASFASLSWFFALGFGARFLAPIFSHPTSWRLLDSVIALIMWSLAFSLIAIELQGNSK